MHAYTGSFTGADGLTLFTRTPQGMALTQDGAALLPQAEKALARGAVQGWDVIGSCA